MVRKVVFVGDQLTELDNILVTLYEAVRGVKYQGALEEGKTLEFPSDHQAPNQFNCLASYSRDITQKQPIDLHVIVFTLSSFKSVVEWHNKITSTQGDSAPVVLICRMDIDNESEEDEKSVSVLGSSIGAASVLFLNLKEAKLSEKWFHIVLPLSYIDSKTSRTKLSLPNRELMSFPQYLINDKVIALNLSFNNIADISCKQLITAAFYNLVDVDLSHNKIQFLSPLFGRLQKLKTLNLNYNQLNFLPGSLGDCPELTKLKVRANNLDSIPSKFYHLKKLSYFDFRENPLNAMFHGVLPSSGKVNCDSQKTKLWKYLEALDQGKTEEYSRVKVMFVGDANVGKTSLLKSMQADQAIGLTDYSVATDGIDLEEIDHGSVTFDCWDFAGQDLYHTTHQFFLTNKAVYLTIFNLETANYKSLLYWLNSIRLRCKYAPVIVVGTHKDSPKCTDMYIDNLCKEVKKQFSAYKIEPTIFTLSTLRDKEKSIKALKNQIEEVAKKRKLIGGSFPLSYAYMINKISSLKKERPFLSLKEMGNYLANYGITEENQVPALQNIHDLGYILYNKNDFALQDIVILDPEFLTKLMRCFVSYTNQWHKTGFVRDSVIPKLLAEYPTELHSKFLALLVKYEILYPLNNGPDPEWIIPCLLPAEPAPDFKSFMTADPPASHVQLRRQIDFGFMPFGFFPRLICRTLTQSISFYWMWRNGVLLSYHQHRGAIEYDPINYRLHILINSPEDDIYNHNLMGILIESVNSLLTTFHGNKKERVKTYIPYTIKEDNISGLIEFSAVVSACIKGETRIEIPEKAGTYLPLKFIASDITEIQDMALKGVEKDKKLGEGAFGVVYKGTYKKQIPGKDALQSLDVAIKELKIADVGVEELDQFIDFLHEINLMKEFDSPYLVKFYGTTMNPLSMVMEFCPAKSLDQILYDKSIPDKDLSWELRIKISLDIAQGLKALHSHKPPVMHRDLRSPNIFINSLQLRPGVVNAKIGDFGLSQYSLPSLNEILACWQWLGPEVFDSESTSYDEKSDVYSYGVVLSEIATRELPFSQFKEYLDVESMKLSDESLSDESVLQTLRSSGYTIVGNEATKEVYKVQLIKKAIIEDNLRPSLNSSTPEAFANIIEDCWHKNPNNRIAIDDVIEDLTGQYSLYSTEVSLLSPRTPSKAKLPRLASRPQCTPQNPEEQLKILLNPNKRFERIVSTNQHTVEIRSIKLKNFIFPLELRRARTVYVRIKYRGISEKTTNSKDKPDASWQLDTPWKVDGDTVSLIPIEIGVNTSLSSVIFGRGAIFCYRLENESPKKGEPFIHDVQIHLVKKGVEFPNQKLGSLELQVAI